MNIAYTGTGIESSNAQFSVVSLCNTPNTTVSNCTNYTSCSFRNLKTGINAFNTNSLTFNVNRAKFGNCNSGILAVGTKNESITENYFDVKEATANTVGIATYASTGYKIEQNTFFESNLSNGIANSYGVVIANSGKLHNEVYKNIFFNLRVGGQSEQVNGTIGVNPNNPISTGLQWKCNIFKDPTTEADLGVNGIIDYHQGYIDNSTTVNAINKAARNEFSLYGENQTLLPEHDIKLFPSSQMLNYVHLFGPIHTPDNVDPMVFPTSPLISGFPVMPPTNGCPSKMTSKPGTTAVANLKITAQNLENIIDGGKTVELLNLLGTDINPYNTVSTYSPFLSDEVLVAFISTSATVSQKKTILSAHAPFTETVQLAISNSTLPQSTKTELFAITGVSERAKLAVQISEARSNFQDAYNDQLSQMYLDTLTAQGEIYEFLKAIDTDQAKKDLLELLVESGDSLTAADLMTDLGSEYSDYIHYLRVAQSINSFASIEEALDHNTTLKNNIQYLIENSSDERIKVQLQAILDYNGNYPQTPEFLPLGDGTSARMEAQDNSINSFENKINYYPNPSTGVVNYQISEDVSELQITIFDVNGRQVFSTKSENTNAGTLNLLHLKEGMYFIENTVNNSERFTTKLEIK